MAPNVFAYAGLVRTSSARFGLASAFKKYSAACLSRANPAPRRRWRLPVGADRKALIGKRYRGIEEIAPGGLAVRGVHVGEHPHDPRHPDRPSRRARIGLRLRSVGIGNPSEVVLRRPRPVRPRGRRTPRRIPKRRRSRPETRPADAGGLRFDSRGPPGRRRSRRRRYHRHPESGKPLEWQADWRSRQQTVARERRSCPCGSRRGLGVDPMSRCPVDEAVVQRCPRSTRCRTGRPMCAGRHSRRIRPAPALRRKQRQRCFGSGCDIARG